MRSSTSYVIKTLLLCVVIISLCLCMSACDSDSWIAAEIDGYGSIKIPSGWKATTVDGFTCLSFEENGNSRKALVQYRNDTNVNEDFSKIDELLWLQDECFSNSADIIKYRVNYKDGSSVEMFALRFTGADDYQSTEFLCVDNSISEDMLKKIAQSYEMK